MKSWFCINDSFRNLIHGWPVLAAAVLAILDLDGENAAWLGFGICQKFTRKKLPDPLKSTMNEINICFLPMCTNVLSNLGQDNTPFTQALHIMHCIATFFLDQNHPVELTVLDKCHPPFPGPTF